MPFRMASPEELENAAELNSNAAKALEEEARVLEERGLPIKAKGKLQQAEDVRDKAKGMRQRALLLRQQHVGELAMQASLISFRCKQTGLWEGYIWEAFQPGTAWTRKCDVWQHVCCFLQNGVWAEWQRMRVC